VTGYSTIAAGLRHGCGMPRFNPASTTASRIPRCWGENNNGQLGRDTATFLPSPQAVPVTMPPSFAFDSLSLVAGAEHTCAFATPDSPQPGRAFCWGSNAWGQLGNGAAIVQGGRSAVPIATGGGTAYVRLYAGDFHTCGLTAAGVAFCWGRNTSGQLGNGNTISTSSPVAVAGGLTFRALALGELHTCGITGTPTVTGTTSVAGSVYCWGDNEKGQLGVGSFGVNGVPVLAPTRVTFQQ
jgi:alpha-tubulin suppressor-like RCC1 family protein